MYAGSNTTIKLLARRDSPEAITLVDDLLMLPLTLGPALWVASTPEQWPLIIGVGVVSGLGGRRPRRPAVPVLAHDIRDRVRHVYGVSGPVDMGGIRGDFRRVLVRDPPERARRILTRAQPSTAHVSRLSARRHGKTSPDRLPTTGITSRFPRLTATSGSTASGHVERTRPIAEPREIAARMASAS